MDSLLRCFLPDKFFDCSEDALDASMEGFEGVLIDLDGVLIDVDGKHSPPDLDGNVRGSVFAKFKQVKENNKVCILTNRTRYRSFDKEGLEKFFGVEVVAIEGLRKPSKQLFREGLKKLDLKASELVMIGDSPYTDIYGANRLGITTFQVYQNRLEYDFPEKWLKTVEDLIQKTIKTVLKNN